jgi:hypothetical protein
LRNPPSRLPDLSLIVSDFVSARCSQTMAQLAARNREMETI